MKYWRFDLCVVFASYDYAKSVADSWWWLLPAAIFTWGAWSYRPWRIVQERERA